MTDAGLRQETGEGSLAYVMWSWHDQQWELIEWRAVYKPRSLCAVDQETNVALLELAAVNLALESLRGHMSGDPNIFQGEAIVDKTYILHGLAKIWHQGVKAGEGEFIK